jgi:hypothetical protein
MDNNRTAKIGNIYFIQNTVTGNVKIGKSINPEQRLVNMQSGSDCPLRLLFSIPVHDMATEEKLLHEKFAAYRLNGEWFRYEGEVSCYLHDLIQKRVKTSQEWKIEQECLRKEAIYASQKPNKKQKIQIELQFKRQLNRDQERKLRKKLRRQSRRQQMRKLRY